MNLSGPQFDSTISSLQSTATVENKRAQLQMLMLRKALDAQQQQSDQIQREAEGKGQIVDLRV